MKPTAEQIEISRACLALNNLGVTLMEKGHFREASKVFKSATCSLKPLVSRKPMAQNALETVRSEFSKASVRSTEPRKEVPPMVEIMAIEEGDNAALERAEQYGPTHSLVFPIRFRDLLSSENLQSDMDFHAAVLLYNHGIARLLLQRFDSRPAESKRLLTTAHHYLVVAEGIVARNIVRHDDGSDRYVWFFSLASLILANQLIIYALQGRNDKAARVNESLGKLQRHHQQWRNNSLPVLRNSGVGAAAA